MRRRARRYGGLAAALLFAAGLVFTASPAHAHANLVSTDPASGTQLDEAPAEVRLRFSERVSLALDGIQLRTADGAEIGTEPAEPDPADPTTVVLPIPADLADGSYLVTFRVVSADSHPIAGALVFGVGVPATPLSEVDISAEDTVVTTVFTVARWTSYTALALLAGVLFFFSLCWPGGWTNRRARRVVLGGWVASLVAGVAVLLLQGPYSSGRPIGELANPDLLSTTMGTDYGWYVLARLGLVLIAGGLILTATRLDRQPAWRTAAALAVGVALAATWRGTGHANTAANPLDGLADLAHLVAMSSWFGGLALLVICVLPRSGGLAAGEVGGVVRRFSLLATTAVLTLVVTGVYVAWRRVGTIDALLGTEYGRLLAFKLAALGVLLWLASMSRSVVRRRYADQAAATEPAEEQPPVAPAEAAEPVTAGRGARPAMMSRLVLTSRIAGRSGTKAAAPAEPASTGGVATKGRPGSSGPARSGTAGKATGTGKGTGTGKSNRAGTGGKSAPAATRPPVDTRSKRRAAKAAAENEHAARTQLRSSVRLEVVAAIGVLAVASMLVATPPGVVVTAAEELAAEAAGPFADQVVVEDDDLIVQVLVDPARTGENLVSLAITNVAYDPLDVPEVRASFVLPGAEGEADDIGPLPVELTETATGEYEMAAAQLPAPGTWRLDVVVRTTDVDSTTVQLEVPVA